MKYDVVIAGAGVLGLSAAYHLAERKQKVLVLEREVLPGMHASGKNAGMFRQLYRSEKLTEWAERSRQGWPKELRANCFLETGSIIAGRQSPEHHSQLFSDRVIQATVSGEKKAVHAVYCKTDGLFDSQRYVNSLFELCRVRGVEIRLHEKLSGITQNGAGWSGETTAGFSFSGAWLVDASGAWLSEILSRTHSYLAVTSQPYARHLFIVSGFPHGYMPAADCGYYWDESTGWYLRLWDETSRLVSICDESPADPNTFRPEEKLTERVEMIVRDLIPQASDVLIRRSWHCFRTYAPDQLPIFGADPRAPGLFWLGAFGGFGMSTSFAAGEDAALIMTGKAADIPTAFSPERARMETSVRRAPY